MMEPYDPWLGDDVADHASSGQNVFMIEGLTTVAEDGGTEVWIQNLSDKTVYLQPGDSLGHALPLESPWDGWEHESPDNAAFKIEVSDGNSREVIIGDKPADDESDGMIQECIILEDEKILDALTERVEATADMDEEDKRLIKAVLYEFSPLFSGRMGRAATVQHTIDTGEAKPARTGMYRYTPSAWEEMRKQV